MTTKGYVGSGADMTALKARGADTYYCGSWGSFQRTLKRGDTAVITRADRISKSTRRQETVTAELAEAGVTLVILGEGPQS